MVEVRVRYNSLFGYGIAGGGLLMLISGVVISNPTSLFFGVFNIALGIGFSTRAWFVFSGKKI